MTSPAENTWRHRLGRNPVWRIASTLWVLALMVLQPLLAIPFVFLFLWLSGLGPRTLGLGAPPSRLSAIGLGLIAALILQGINRLAVLPALAVIVPNPDTAASTLGLAPGAWDMLLIFIPIAIVSAGFGEELAARGYALNTFARMMGDTVPARWIAMGLVAVLFGLAHFYQGPLGTAHAIWMGLCLGGLYLAHRSLWTAITAHAAYNICTAVLIVSGALEQLYAIAPFTRI